MVKKTAVRRCDKLLHTVRAYDIVQTVATVYMVMVRVVCVRVVPGLWWTALAAWGLDMVDHGVSGTRVLCYLAGIGSAVQLVYIGIRPTWLGLWLRCLNRCGAVGVYVLCSSPCVCSCQAMHAVAASAEYQRVELMEAQAAFELYAEATFPRDRIAWLTDHARRKPRTVRGGGSESSLTDSTTRLFPGFFNKPSGSSTCP